MNLDISYQPAKFKIPQLSESNFTEVFKRHLKNHYDVIMTLLCNICLLKLHIVELNRRHQPAKFHWPGLSGSHFTRDGGKHPLRLTRSQKAQS